MKRILLALLLIATTQCLAQQSGDELDNEVMDNMSHDFVKCSAYFLIVSNAMEALGRDDLSVSYANNSQLSYVQSLVTAEFGRTEEMAQKVVAARMQLAVKEMAEEIGSDNANISLLAENYGELCKSIIEDPDKRIKELYVQATNRRASKD